MNFKKIYYINLKKDKQRKSFIENQYYQTNSCSTPLPPLERIDGFSVTEKDISSGGKFFDLTKRYSDIFKNSYGVSTPHSRATLGCYLSHKKVYQKIAQSSDGHYIVLEDDIILSKNWFTNLCNLTLGVDFKFDIIRQMWISDCPGAFSRIEKFNICSKYVAPWNSSSYSGGLHFQIVNQSSANKILDFLNTENIFDIDAVLHNPILNIFHTKISGVEHNFDFESNIKRPWDIKNQ